MKNFRLPKWAIIIVAAALFLALSVDWVAPGSGARLAVEWLGGVRQPSELFPLWGWLVRHAGRDIVALRQARVAWMAQGCPNEHGNVYGLFSEEQGAFARSVLRLQCGIDAQYARTRLNDLSNQGVWEARLYMESRLRGGKR